MKGKTDWVHGQVEWVLAFGSVIVSMEQDMETASIKQLVTLLVAVSLGLVAVAWGGCARQDFVPYKNSFWAERDPARYVGGGP